MLCVSDILRSMNAADVITTIVIVGLDEQQNTEFCAKDCGHGVSRGP